MSKITIIKSEAIDLVSKASNKKDAITLLCDTYQMNKSNASKTLAKLNVKFGRQTIELVDESQPAVLEAAHV